MTLAEQIELACLMEATARKPGNVHPGASFDDLTYDDFARAAEAIAEPLSHVRDVGLGQAVFRAVEATQRVAGTNVNLGIALLTAPLVAVPADVQLGAGIHDVLFGTTIEDAEHVYAAIRLAQPGGMGEVSSQDINGRPTVTLRDAMALAADRDRIAEQYVTDFDLVLNKCLPVFCRVWTHFKELITAVAHRDSSTVAASMQYWEMAILDLQMRILADSPDSLIARKCGIEFAIEVQNRARNWHRLNSSDADNASAELKDFDRWLREDGHRRNPGTTADLIAATLFAALRDGRIEAPSREEVLRHAAKIRETTIGKTAP